MRDAALRVRRIALIACVGALCAHPAPAARPAGEAPSGREAPAYRGIEVPDPGSISGVVKAPPPSEAPKPLHVVKDIDKCGERIPDETLLVNAEGEVQNAVVSIENISEGVPIDRTLRPRLYNSGCRFQPHVLAVAVGQKVEIVNGDPLLHSTHAKMDGKVTVFNVALPVQNQKIPKAILEPGLMELTCDAGHIWMTGYLLAFEHPYFAVTDEEGSFGIAKIPPGTYRIRAWHETLGEQVKEVTVKAGENAEIVFDSLAPAGP